VHWITPHAPQPLLAELERGGDWQISDASAKIVSDFSLETNCYRLGFRVSPEGSLPLGQTRGYTSCSLRSRPPPR
jgi:hypothetical protein